MKICRVCKCVIGWDKVLCGSCEWAATRPARLARRRIRAAFVLDYDKLTDAGLPTLVPVGLNAA